jgi:phosphoenolpyruvate-protein kinase (PTS system EI component)
MHKVGKGMLISGSECDGVLRVIETVQDVIGLMKTDVSNVILFTRSASATTVTPLFSRIKGVICTAGGPTSHLAIVAREFDIPCVMASEIQYDGNLDQQSVCINKEGEIFLASA